MATDSEIELMADCMDETRRMLIDAGVIDKSVPPIFVAEAVIVAWRQDAQAARRYRWLRDDANDAHKSAPMVASNPLDASCIRLIHGAELDTAIDAAMADAAPTGARDE